MAYQDKNYYGVEREPSDDLWTKEAARIKQITDLENKINLYKEQQLWEQCLNSMEDYLRFQMEAMQEKRKYKDEATGKERTETVKGLDTPKYQELKIRLRELLREIKQAGRRTSDPVARQNRAEEYEDLIDKIKDTIDDLYHLNVTFGLSYKKKLDPYEAYLEEDE